MHHCGTITMETNRLALRRFTLADAPMAFRNWMSSPAVTKYLRWQTHTNPEESAEIIGDWIAAYEKQDFYLWAIELKEIGEPIGTISVVEQNERLDLLHIGYCIGEDWWGKGIMTEAFSAVIPLLFEQVGANRIESQHDPENPGSGKVMRKCGLQYEGTMRQADFNNQGIVDAAMYALLARDYRKIKRQ